MRRLYILFAALFAAPAVGTFPCFGQSSSPLVFDVAEWGFGDVREEGGAVSHVFRFTNTGLAPIAIDRVSASCGCTTPQYPRRPIAPGASADITVTFDPTGYPGEFSKSVGVVSGGGKHSNFLTVTGRVVPRPKTIEDEYPGDVGGGVRIDKTLLAFRTVARGSASSMTVKYVNTSPRAASVAFEPVENQTSGLLSVHAPESICAGCRGEMTLTYDLTEKTGYGAVHDVTRVVVNGVAAQTTIYTSMTGVDDFSGVDMDTAPRLFLDGQFHDFGEVRQRTIPYIYRLTASNEGGEVLHIRSVGEGKGFGVTLRGGMTIAPGASLPFEVVFYSDKYFTGKARDSVVIVTDDPSRPVREIRIAAIIK